MQLETTTDEQIVAGRVKEHAKLFNVDGRQVLVFLQRGDYDALRVVLQAWVAEEDRQIRAEIAFDDPHGKSDISEHAVSFLFGRLDEELLRQVMNEVGLNEAIAEVEHG